MEIIEYIDIALKERNKEKNKPFDNVHAKTAFDYGNQYAGFTFKDGELLTSVDYKNLPESTPSRQIVSDSVPALCSWAMDDRSVRLTSGVAVANGQAGPELSTKELMVVEKQIRGMMMKHWFDDYFNQLLITGVGVVSAGLEDTFCVVNSNDVRFDGDQDQWILFDRMITGETMNNVVSTWEPLFNAAAVTHPESVDVKVTHGQVHVPHLGGYVEFVCYGPEKYIRRHNGPVMFRQVFAVDHQGRPIGVHGIIRNEELTIVKLQQAISSRVNEAIQASAFVSSDLLEDANADVNELYSGQLITMKNLNMANDPNAVMNPIVPVTSRTNEIPIYEAYMDRLMRKCYQMTGLHPRPVTIAGSNTSATEALMVYKNSTLRMRQIIGDFSKVMGGVIRAIALRDYGVEAMFDARNNPLDYEERKAAMEKLLPDMVKMLSDDPTGKITGGLVNAKTVHQLYADLMEAYGVPAEYLAEPGPSQTQSPEAMAAAQQKEQSAADKIAQAEVMKGQGSLLRAQVSAAELDLSNRSHNDNAVMELLKLLNTARERGDKTMEKHIAQAMSTIGLNRDGAKSLTQGVGNANQAPPQGGQ